MIKQLEKMLGQVEKELMEIGVKICAANKRSKEFRKILIENERKIGRMQTLREVIKLTKEERINDDPRTSGKHHGGSENYVR